MPAYVHKDDDHLAGGTHKGANSATTISDPGKHFSSCGVVAGLAVKNTTASTTGTVVSATEDAVVTNIAWTTGATYRIYKTTTYNSTISRSWVDRRSGRKAEKQSELVDDLFPEDIDLDENTDNVFGPFQPERR